MRAKQTLAVSETVNDKSRKVRYFHLLAFLSSRPKNMGENSNYLLEEKEEKECSEMEMKLSRSPYTFPIMYSDTN